VLTEADHVIGLVADRDRFLARWTLDATGRSAWLARQLGLAERVSSPPLFVRFGWHQDGDRHLGGMPCFTYRDDGWDWRAPLTEARTAWVSLRIHEPGDCRRHGLDLTWRHRPHSAGPGFFLAGDAAALLDPSASHGVLKALLSGILITHLAVACVRGRATEETIIADYRAWVAEQFGHDQARLRQLYADSAAGPRLSTEPQSAPQLTAMESTVDRYPTTAVASTSQRISGR
jgi:flavin-dependent dehydrogenase